MSHHTSGHTPLEIVLQRFPRATSAQVDESQARTLAEIFDQIKSPAPEARAAIAAIRAEADNDKRQALKKRLPYVCLSAQFRPGTSRKSENVETLTGLMQIDLDHVQDVETGKAALKSLPYVLAVFRSPSGDGVKGIALIHAADNAADKAAFHLAAYHQISADVKRIGYENDPSIKDMARACFLSHDPELWVNDTAQPLAVDLNAVKVETTKAKQRKAKTTDANARALTDAELSGVQRVIFERFTRGEKISDGRRKALYNVGLAAHDAGLPVSAAVSLALSVNAAICLPQKDSAEVAEQVSSAYAFALSPLGSRADEIAREAARRERETIKAAHVQTVCKQYLEPADLSGIDARAVLVESVQGTGKTECVKALVAEAKRAGKPVVYMAHRVALLRQASAKLSLTFYRDAVHGIAHDLATTPNSLPKMIPVLSRYAGAVIFVDEVDQVLKDICGKTCKEERQAILTTFSALLKNAGKVYGLSADITPTVFETFKDLAFEPAILRNTFHTERKAVRFAKLPALRADIEANIERGQKVAIACDSKTRAKTLHRSIESRYAKKACLLITEENSQSQDVQDLFKSPAGFAKFDVVIYSPSMGSGLDINLPFGAVQYLIAGGRTVSANELLQMATRFRQWPELRFYCKPITLKRPLSENPAAIAKEWAEKESDYAGLFYRDMKNPADVKALPGYEWAVNLSANVQGEVNASRNNLFARFADCLNKKGFILSERESEYSEAIDEIKARDKTAMAELKTEYVTAVLDPANDISEFEAEIFKRDGIACFADRVKEDRFYYKKTIGTDDADTMAEAVKVSLSQRIKQASAFTSFVDSPKDLASREREKNEKAILHHECSFEAMKATIRQRVESAVGLLSGSLSAAMSRDGYSEADSDTLRQIIDENAADVSRYLFDVTDAMREKPVLFLRSLYGQAGIKLKAKAKGKTRTRFYTADGETVAFMQGIYDRKAAERQAAQAMRENPFKVFQDDILDLFGQKVAG